MGQLDEVMDVLGVNKSMILGGNWQECAGGNAGSANWAYYSSNANTITSYYEPLFEMFDKEKFKVLVYSGDEDIATVPHPETQQCLAEMSDVKGERIFEWGNWRINGISC